MVDRKKVESTPIPFVADGESGALAILGEIVDVQREYMRDGDPQRMWDELLSSLMRTTASRGGIIGEVEWSPRGIPSLNTRAMAWDIESGTHAALHLDIGLLVSRIIAEQAPVVIDLAETPGASRKGPIGQFLGLPLLSSDRLVGLLGLSNPSERYGEHWADDSSHCCGRVPASSNPCGRPPTGAVSSVSSSGWRGSCRRSSTPARMRFS